MKKEIKTKIKKNEWVKLVIVYSRPWWKFWSNGTFSVWINGRERKSK